MKKNTLILLLAMLGFTATQAQVKFGIKAGYSMTNMSQQYPASVTLPAAKTLSGFHAGLLFDFILAENFSLQPELLYSAKGYHTTPYYNLRPPVVQPAEPQPEGKMSINYHYNYLELPVNFLYKLPLGPGRLFGGFGPYLAYGLNGKVTGLPYTDVFKIRFDGKAATNSIDFHAKRFDAGANFIIGYELKMGLLVSANYSLGLTNNNPWAGYNDKNRYLGISIGYLLQRK